MRSPFRSLRVSCPRFPEVGKIISSNFNGSFMVRPFWSTISLPSRGVVLVKSFIEAPLSRMQRVNISNGVVGLCPDEYLTGAKVRYESLHVRPFLRGSGLTDCVVQMCDIGLDGGRVAVGKAYKVQALSKIAREDTAESRMTSKICGLFFPARLVLVMNL